MASYAELALRISADIKEFEKSINTMTGKLKSMSEKALPASRAVAGGLLAVGAAALGLAGKAIGLAADIEQVEVAFGTLLGSEEAAGKMIKNLQDFAASTPFQFPGLADAARQLVAFGIDADETIPTLRRIGDVAAGIGAPIGDIAEIYGKARVQGRLFAEDINQLTGRGIPIIGELAKQFGVSESEVRKLVESGQVNFGHLEEAFKSLTSEGGKFEGLMEDQSQTVAGLWSTLKDNVGLALTSMGQTIIDTFNLKDVLKNVIEFANGVKEKFEDFAARVEEIGLRETLNEIFTPELRMKLGIIAGAITGALVPAFYALASGVWAAMAPLLPFIVAGAALAGIIIYLWQTNEGFRDLVISAWGKIKEAFNTAVTVIQAALSSIQEWWDKWGDTIISAAQYLWDIIKNIFITAWEIIKSVVGSAFEVIAGIFNIFAGLLTGDWRRLWDGIKSVARGAGNVIIGIANAVIGAFERMVNAVGSAINRIPKFTIPDWIPLIGGNSFGLPNIPRISLPRIPQLAQGTNYVPQDMLVYAHKGEAIVPKQYNPAAGGQDQKMNGPMIGTVTITTENPNKAIRSFERMQRNLAIEWGLA